MNCKCGSLSKSTQIIHTHQIRLLNIPISNTYLNLGVITFSEVEEPFIGKIYDT